MALYQIGQLERKKAGATADCVVFAWHDFRSDLAALCNELHRWHERMLHAPKFLLQVRPHSPGHVVDAVTLLSHLVVQNLRGLSNRVRQNGAVIWYKVQL